jgi:hypothetical protein
MASAGNYRSSSHGLRDGMLNFRPLMIDPQGQAKKWIKANRGKALVVVRPGHPTLLRTLEAAVRNGNPVMIEDLDETVESSLDPILNKVLFLLVTFLFLSNAFNC